LGISIPTANNHRQFLYRKLGIHNTAPLARWVFEQTAFAFMMNPEENLAAALNTPVPGIQPGSPSPPSKPGKARGARAKAGGTS